MAIGDGLLSASTSAATGNYVSAGLSLLGVGMQLMSANEQADIQKQEASLSRDIHSQEEAENAQRQQAMELSARRQEIQIVRNTQRQRALGLLSATTQGARGGIGQQSSGLGGGQADVFSQGQFNFMGVAQNLQIGENIFGIDKIISNDKMQMSSLQGDAANAGVLGSIGGAIGKSADPVGRLSGQLYSSKSPFSSGPQSTLPDPLGGGIY